MIKKGKVFYKNLFAGTIEENEDGYFFTYDANYLKLPESKPVSLTMPIKKESYLSKTMFPFFDGLIPEGWLLDIAETNWKINQRDRMGLLLAFCKDCIGAVSIIPLEEDKV
jgi:serine/threonine-protein kinase HipA